jgi:hypothetical protein
MNHSSASPPDCRAACEELLQAIIADIAHPEPSGCARIDLVERVEHLRQLVAYAPASSVASTDIEYRFRDFVLALRATQSDQYPKESLA